MLWNSRPRRRWGRIVFGVIASAAIIALGTFFMWGQHHGVPARVTVQSCEDRGDRFSDQVFGYAFGDSCTTSQRNDGRFLEFWGVYRNDVGHDIDVHIMRGTGVFDEAVPDGWIVPKIVIGVGGLVGVLTVVGIVRRLRPRPMAAAWTGQPWPGTQY